MGHPLFQLAVELGNPAFYAFGGLSERHPELGRSSASTSWLIVYIGLGPDSPMSVDFGSYKSAHLWGPISMRKNCCLIILSCYLSISLYAVRAQSQQKANAAPPANTHKDTSTSSRQILVRVQLAEVSLSKMRKLGIEFAGFEESKAVKHTGSDLLKPNSSLTYSSGHFNDLLNALVKNKVAHILAEPAIVSLDGKTASLSIGDSVIIDNKRSVKQVDQPSFVRVGTELTILPTLLPNDKVLIDLRLGWSELRGADKPLSSVQHCEIDTSLETQLGSSFLMASSSFFQPSANTGEEEKARILVVTPTLIDETASSKE